MASLQFRSSITGADVVDVFEVGLADKRGGGEIVLADDFLAGGTVGNATIASR